MNLSDLPQTYQDQVAALSRDYQARRLFPTRAECEAAAFETIRDAYLAAQARTAAKIAKASEPKLW